MVIKYKKRRRLFIKILSILVVIFFIATVINATQNEINYITLITFVLQIVLWIGLYYYQAARYDQNQVIAQYGWPRINYENIISVTTKFGDIIITSEKREISINRESVEEKSLKTFVEFLHKKTAIPLDKKTLL